MIRVFVAEDQKTVQQILKSYLELEPDLEVVGTAVNGQIAVEQVEALKPDVVIMDIEMPVIDGLSATKIISQRFEHTKVLILSVHDDNKYLNNALQVGAKGYLLKTTPPKDLVNAIRAIHQGYFQLGPGLVDKFNAEASIVSTSDYNSNGSAKLQPQSQLQKHDNGATLLKTEAGKLQTVDPDFLIVSPQEESDSQWRKYIGLGITLNALIWALVFAYVKFFPHTYTSKWGVKILESSPGAEIILPDGSKASSSNNFKRPLESPDPRTDYVYLATSRPILEKAAKKFDTTVKKFGEPEVTVDEDSGLIAFEINGKTPTQAQRKAWLLHQTINEQVKQLRNAELKRQEKETQATLEQARQKLNKAQDKVSQYRAASKISTDEQIKDLSVNIESLRRQQADLLSQETGLKSRYGQLSGDLKLSSPEAADAYKLQADNVYQQYLQQYAQAKRSLSNLSSKFTPEYPQVVETKAEMEEAATALQQRAAFVLGKPVSLATLTKLALSGTGNASRDDIYKDLVTNRAEQQRMLAQNKELNVQIANLEDRLKKLSKEKIKGDRLNRDLEIANAVFAATLAKLDFSKESIYANYPPSQLVTEPSLPEKDDPTAPNLRSALLGGIAGSFLVTTGIFLFRSDKTRPQE